METIFKVGDRVFDIRFGWGKVHDVKKHFVFVTFNEGDDPFTYTGANMIHLLSFTEYTLQGFSQERPRKKPEIGSLCLFSDDEGELKENIGRSGILIDIDYDRQFKYKREGGAWFESCKQIEIKEVTD